MPEEVRHRPDVSELAAWGCGTTMHVIKLVAPRLGYEDQTKDIDFSVQGIRARWQAGYSGAQRTLAARPWEYQVDPRDGVMIHDPA
jgi:NTE family protein